MTDNYPDGVVNIPEDEKVRCNICDFTGYATSFQRIRCVNDNIFLKHHVCPNCRCCLTCGEYMEEEC